MLVDSATHVHNVTAAQSKMMWACHGSVGVLTLRSQSCNTTQVQHASCTVTLHCMLHDTDACIIPYIALRDAHNCTTVMRRTSARWLTQQQQQQQCGVCAAGRLVCAPHRVCVRRVQHPHEQATAAYVQPVLRSWHAQAHAHTCHMLLYRCACVSPLLSRNVCPSSPDTTSCSTAAAATTTSATAATTTAAAVWQRAIRSPSASLPSLSPVYHTAAAAAATATTATATATATAASWAQLRASQHTSNDSMMTSSDT